MPVKHAPMKKHVAVGCLLVLGSTGMASGQTGPVSVPGDATAIVNVNVVSMDSEHVDAGRTVLVRGDRILAIGAAGELAPPRGATVIDGAGRWLVPGLTDAHVHLEGDGTGFGTASSTRNPGCCIDSTGYGPFRSRTVRARLAFDRNAPAGRSCRHAGGQEGGEMYAADPHAMAVALEAQRLVELRDRWLNPPDWVEWVDAPVPGYPSGRFSATRTRRRRSRDGR